MPRHSSEFEPQIWTQTHENIYRSRVRQIMDRVHAGEIGDIRLIEIECSGWDIINAGIHWLNFADVLTGNEPVDFVMAAVDKSTGGGRDGRKINEN